MDRLFDIIYKEPREDLPKEIVVDLSKYNWVVKGLGHLNSKAYLAIKDATGCESISCKLDISFKK